MQSGLITTVLEKDEMNIKIILVSPTSTSCEPVSPHKITYPSKQPILARTIFSSKTCWQNKMFRSLKNIYGSVHYQYVNPLKAGTLSWIHLYTPRYQAWGLAQKTCSITIYRTKSINCPPSTSNLEMGMCSIKKRQNCLKFSFFTKLSWQPVNVIKTSECCHKY